MKARRTVFVLIMFLSLVLTVGGQNPFEAPDESYKIELSSGWNTLSIPASGHGYRIGVNDLLETDGQRCDLKHGEKAFTFEGEGEASNVIEAQRGYAVYVENDNGCSMEFEPNQLSYSDTYSDNGIEKIRTDEGWKVVSVPREMKLSSYKETIVPGCNLADPVDSGVEAYQIDPVTFENVPLSESDNMDALNVYWIKTSSNCDMNMSDFAGKSKSANNSDSEESSDEEKKVSSSDLEEPHNGWTYEGEVEPDRSGVNDQGELIIEHSSCGKVYYEKDEFESDEITFQIEFIAQNWEGMAGVWYTDSSGDLKLDDQSIRSRHITDPENVEKEGEVTVENLTGPLQIGFSADIGMCGDVGNAEMRVEMK